MKIALGIEYDGSVFNGWQRQNHGHGVQEDVEKALSIVANHDVKVICAGRTDTGVHGLGQVIHFETMSQRSEHSWVSGANANLPHSVTVHWAKVVKDDFHARFSALSRTYQYLILDQPVRPAVLSKKVTWDYRKLDVSRMQQAIPYLIGKHDFSSFRAVACQASSPERTISLLEIRREGKFICIDIQANAFLQHMVRNIAGVLMTVGCGEKEPLWVQQVLEFHDRTRGGVTAPPHGLYFKSVEYPEEFEIPAKTGTGLFSST